jgi:hypothetical protein
MPVFNIDKSGHIRFVQTDIVEPVGILPERIGIGWIIDRTLGMGGQKHKPFVPLFPQERAEPCPALAVDCGFKHRTILCGLEELVNEGQLKAVKNKFCSSFLSIRK